MRIGRAKTDAEEKRKIVWVDSLINPSQWITGSSSLYLAYQASQFYTKTGKKARFPSIFSTNLRLVPLYDFFSFLQILLA